MGSTLIDIGCNFDVFFVLFLFHCYIYLCVYLAGVFLVVITLAIAMVSIRYKRLHVLVATLRVPRHRLDDFTVLQEYAAAVTIFDAPVNTETVVAAYRLVFVQILLVALSAMRS